MSRVISFRDLLAVVPSLATYREFDLLHPSMDNRMASILAQLGFNVNAPVEYIPAKHRDMFGAVAVGFRAVGTIATGHPFLRSRLATMEDRIMDVYFKDPSLAQELSLMLGRGISFDEDTLFAEDEEDFPEELIEPDFEDVSKALRLMEALRDSVRGPTHNSSGAPKTYEEYKEYYEQQQATVETF